MKKIALILTILMSIMCISCDGRVDRLLFEGREYKVTYKAGSGVGEDYSTNTVQGYHEILPNSQLEFDLSKSIFDDPSQAYTGYYKKDFSFYGWTDQDGVYYQHSLNKKKNSFKFTKDVILEALWRNDITGDIITGTQFAAITDYRGSEAETLIIPTVITIWDDPAYPNGKECLVTVIESGAVTDDTVTTVILPDSVSEIKENAFSNCDRLENVEISSVTPPSIAENAIPSRATVQVPEDADETYINRLTSDTDLRVEKKESDQPIVLNNAVTAVNFSSDNISLKVGDSKRLTYSITPGNATNQKAIITSSNIDIATVLSDGTVTAIAAGTATIKITTVDGGFTDECLVTVVTTEKPVTGVSFNKSSTIITVGQSETLKATVTPSDATNKDVTFNSSDTSIAKVDADGKVTGIKSGEATITATVKAGLNEYTDTCVVTINSVRVSGVSINTTSTSLDINEEITLTATVTPSDANDKKVTWSSSNTSVATVDKNTGKVKGISVGTAIIIATTNDGSFTASCIVKVNNSSAGFEVNSQFPTISGTLSSTGTDSITITLNSQDTITSYMWFIDNRPVTGETSSSITISSSLWKRTVKCLFSNNTASNQASIVIPGTQFN